MKLALLAIETATDVCGIALHDGTRVIASFTLRQRQQHARALVPLVAAALDYLPGGWASVGAVAVSAGPGSYTGLRIGLSVAKGLCAARDLALVAVPSLDALAAQVPPFARTGDVVGAAFHSRRGEVYAAWYRVAEDRLEPVHAPAAFDLSGEMPRLPETSRLWLVGEGAAALAQALPVHPAPEVIPAERLSPDPASVARLGHARWQAGHLENVAAFEPYYLKPFAARTPAASLLEASQASDPE